MSDPLRVLLVTTWGTDCGIAEHSAMLKEAVEEADAEISLFPNSDLLDPRALDDGRGVDVLHLNYHAALHSRWTAETIRFARQAGMKVLVTYHDTGVPNSEQCRTVIAAADAAVVHEPFDDLPADKTRYWRMGVPGWAMPYRFQDRRPLLGTVGFPFPWKNYDQLCEVTAAAGWQLLLVAPRATAKDVERWHDLQPHLTVETKFEDRRHVVAMLSGCDATAFCYTCANTGQSGAICLGIAARKPVIAFEHCRQFRALLADPLGGSAIHWADNFADVLHALHTMPIQRCFPAVVALAEQDSWARLGAKYAQLYRSLVD